MMPAEQRARPLKSSVRRGEAISIPEHSEYDSRGLRMEIVA